MSHPSLGLPPSDPTAGLPDAAARIRTNEPRLAARALRVAMDADATIERRFDETGLRQLLRDAELLAERVAVSVETGRPDLAREYAEWTAPVYRRRGVSMDDVVALCEGLREAFPSVLAPGELPAAGCGARRGHQGLPLASPDRRRRAQEERLPPVPVQGRLSG